MKKVDGWKDKESHLDTMIIKGINWSSNKSAFIDEWLVDPNDPVIIEREVMKFKPGISQNYISRWVQITKKAFRYYWNYYHSASGFAKPLVAIPFSSIQDVKRVKIHY